MAYTYAELKKAYRQVGIGPGKVVYATSDLVRVAAFEVRGAQPILEAHYRALRELLGEEGTLVVPAASTNLCNTNIPFDCTQTPSFRVGSLSEFVRRQAGAVRSYHPFVSYAAIGPKAAEITSNVSRHAFGPETPEARLIFMNALHVYIGLRPEMSVSTVHHVEHVMAVPYRYTKEFLHPVVRNGKVVREPYYMHVRYLDIGVESDDNQKLFERIGDKLIIAEANLGRGTLWAYSMAVFYDQAVKVFGDDIYVWCKEPPPVRPYTN